MNNDVLQELLNELKKRYDLDDETGCFTKTGSWLSVSRIVSIILVLDEEY